MADESTPEAPPADEPVPPRVRRSLARVYRGRAVWNLTNRDDKVIGVLVADMDGLARRCYKDEARALAYLDSIPPPGAGSLHTENAYQSTSEDDEEWPELVL